MIDGLKPYPKYKDSGVEWLGKVPEHWDLSFLRRALRPYDGIKIGPFGSQLKLENMSPSGYKVYGQANVIARDFIRGSKFVDDAKFRELTACSLSPGDLLITMMGTSGRCAIVPDSAAIGIMDSHLLRLRTIPELVPHFAALVLDEAPYAREQIAAAGKGSIMQGLNSGLVKDLLLLLPTVGEQRSIIHYLKQVDLLVMRYIRAKQKLIKLLEEQKQAIIHRAVTRGLDPSVRLKPSGIEWLPDIPEDWVQLRLKTVAHVQTGLTLGKNYGSTPLEERPYLRVANVQAGRLVLDLVKTVSVPRPEAIATALRPGDVLMTEGGDIDKIGRGCVWQGEIEGCLHQNHIFAVRPEVARLLPDFLEAAMTSRHGRIYFQITAKQTTNLASTNSSTLGDFPLLLPNVAKQAAILKAVSEETQAISSAMERADREVTLVRDFRTRLIADVVTGKLDVREAAAKLPDEPIEGAEDLAEEISETEPEESEIAEEVEA